MRARRYLAVLGAIGLSVPMAAQTVNIRPGKYEVTVEWNMPEMRMPMPPQKNEECITSNEATDVKAALEAAAKTNPQLECKVSDLKWSGNTVRFTQTCKNGVYKSELTYGGDSFVGVSKGQDSGGRAFTVKTNAKRIGDCMK